MKQSQEHNIALKTLKAEASKGGLVNFVGPSGNARTSVVLDLMEILKSKGYFVHGINAENHQNDLHIVLSVLQSNNNHEKKLIIVDNFDMAKANDDHISEIQKTINNFWKNKNCTIILVTSVDIARLINEGFRLVSSFISSKFKIVSFEIGNKWNVIIPIALAGVAINPIGLAFGACGIVGGGIVGGAATGLLYLLNMKKNYSISGNKLPQSLDIFDNQTRKRISLLIAEILSGADRNSICLKNENTKNYLEYLLASEIFVNDIKGNIAPGKWIVNALRAKENIDPSSVKEKHCLQKVIDQCLLAFASECFLKYIANKHEWLKDEINDTGFRIDSSKGELAEFLIRTGQEPFEYLKGLFRVSDLKTILSEAVDSGLSKTDLLNLVIQRCREKVGT